MFKFSTILALLFSSVTAFATPKISPRDAKKAVDDGKAVLIDVRDEVEINESGMAEPAKWFPSTDAVPGSQKFKDFQAGLDSKKTVILYCRSGRRSAGVAEKLEANGFKTANMGAFDDWKRNGLPTKAHP